MHASRAGSAAHGSCARVSLPYYRPLPGTEWACSLWSFCLCCHDDTQPVRHDGDHVACEAWHAHHVTPHRKTFPSVLWNHGLEHEEEGNRKFEPPQSFLFPRCGLDKCSSKIMSWRFLTPPPTSQCSRRVVGPLEGEVWREEIRSLAVCLPLYPCFAGAVNRASGFLCHMCTSAVTHYVTRPKSSGDGHPWVSHLIAQVFCYSDVWVSTARVCFLGAFVAFELKALSACAKGRWQVTTWRLSRLLWCSRTCDAKGGKSRFSPESPGCEPGIAHRSVLYTPGLGGHRLKHSARK